MLLSSLLFFIGTTTGVTLYKRIRQTSPPKTLSIKSFFKKNQQIATKLSKQNEIKKEELQTDQEINHYLTFQQLL